MIFSVPISGQKKQNMMDLLQFISPVHHRFFLSLVTALEEEEEDIGPLPYVESQSDEKCDEMD